MNYIELNNFLEINQPIWTFYVAKITPKSLKRISKDNLSRYEDVENWIQRDLSTDRQREIKKYISENPDATFPNSFIIAVSWETIIKDWKILIPDRDDEAYILDWQHRLSWFNDDDENFEIIVSIFIDIDIFDQAMIFATINWKQSKVDKSLVYDLFDLSDKRSYEKVAHDIVKLLNENESSAWYKQIKMLWKWDWIISQSAMVESYIKLFNKWVLKWFYDKEEDWKIYKILENYFNAVREIFHKEFWNKEYILCKTTWFNALIKIFGDLYNIAINKKEPLTKNFFINFFIDFNNYLMSEWKELKNEYYRAWWVWVKDLYNDFKNTLDI